MFLYRSTLKFVVLDYDKFSRSEFVAEVLLSLLEIDLVEGTTVSHNLNSKAISEVSDCHSFDGTGDTTLCDNRYSFKRAL